jgi:hypothetical protein
MKRLLLIALLFPLNSFSQEYEPYKGGSLSSRAIDSIIQLENLSANLMANRSLKEQRARNKAIRKTLPKELRPFRLISVVVKKGVVDPNARDGKGQNIFTHSWYALLKDDDIYENNAFLTTGQEINFSNPRELAIKKLEEQKKLLDLEVITREEYDSIRKALTPIILD